MIVLAWILSRSGADSVAVGLGTVDNTVAIVHNVTIRTPMVVGK